MSGSVFLIELVLVFGLVLGFAVWQLLPVPAGNPPGPGEAAKRRDMT